MIPLTRHSTDVSSVFSLLGANENDLTFTLGFALSRCSPLAEAIVARIAGAVGARLDGFDQLKPQGQGTGAPLSQPSQFRPVRNRIRTTTPVRLVRNPDSPSRFARRPPGGHTRFPAVIPCGSPVAVRGRST